MWHSSKWPFSRGDLPQRPAVYAIYFDGQLKYIGQSNNIANRFSGRAMRYGFARNIHTPWGEFKDTTSIVVKYHHGWRRGDWAMREIRLIHRVRPEFNRHHRGRATNV